MLIVFPFCLSLPLVPPWCTTQGAYALCGECNQRSGPFSLPSLRQPGAEYGILVRALLLFACITSCHQDAAALGQLNSTLHRHLNASLSTFSIAQLSLLVSVIPHVKLALRHYGPIFIMLQNDNWIVDCVGLSY